MIAARQLAKQVTEALEDANPARLIELAESRELVKFLDQKIKAFKLQFVREMAGKPKAAEIAVTEGLMPMLVEYPMAKSKPTLTPQQRAMVVAALDQYEEMIYPPSQASLAAPTSA